MDAVVPGQRSLFASGEVALDVEARWERVELDTECWVDVCRSRLRGADTVLDVVVDSVPWQCGRRFMYDRMVDDPRLTYRCPRPEQVPHPVLGHVRNDLVARYGVAFGSCGLNYYRDGNDSVAFHRDRELRDSDDALVAILTLGQTRPFRLRRHGRGGASIDLSPGSGDLLVMGGACQRDWEHGVPKVRSVGPRVSAHWRWVTPACEEPPSRG
jgi:alkylated DNA repair dioxygenase AlkB